jgi:hypothetical protein
LRFSGFTPVFPRLTALTGSSGHDPLATVEKQSFSLLTGCQIYFAILKHSRLKTAKSH